MQVTTPLGSIRIDNRILLPPGFSGLPPQSVVNNKHVGVTNFIWIEETLRGYWRNRCTYTPGLLAQCTGVWVSFDDITLF
jgi:hypothetical protein